MGLKMHCCNLPKWIENEDLLVTKYNYSIYKTPKYTELSKLWRINGITYIIDIFICPDDKTNHLRIYMSLDMYLTESNELRGSGFQLCHVTNNYEEDILPLISKGIVEAKSNILKLFDDLNELKK